MDWQSLQGSPTPKVSREMTATFVGEDGSMGLKHGERYFIFDNYIEHNFSIMIKVSTIPFNPRMQLKCMYDGLDAVVQNWADIKPYKEEL